MEPVVAVNLIKEGVVPSTPAHWADLGAGTGTFTEALAELLPGKGNIVYAIDKDTSALDKIGQYVGDVTIMKLPIDFIDDELPLQDLDGILMANAIHFVKDKIALLARLKKILKPQGRLLVVEYDTLTPNTWVPYPINYITLEKIMRDLDFTTVIKLGEQPSLYNSRKIYSALVK